MDKNKIIKIAVAFLLVVVVCIGIDLGAFMSKKKIDTNSNDVELTKNTSGEQLEEVVNNTPEPEIEKVEEPTYLGPNIFSGDSRPIAVMIDNERPAWVNHGGLNHAYMLYEFIIEGGETRIMAYFKNVNPSYIGPVRSTRHYFLDYAMEHDAILVHFGWSPLAQSNIKTFGINNINGIYDNFYWRVAPKSSYHNAITSMENIKKQISYKKYRDTSDKGPIIAYNKYDTDISSGENIKSIWVKYNGLQSIMYNYDSDKKIFYRSMIRNGNKSDAYKHVDAQTGEQFYAENIIMIFVKDELLDDPEDKGRRNLYNVTTGKGYYATNGKIEPITYEKKSRESKTVYRDEAGNVLTINDGITWVQIIPITGSVTYES